MVSKKENASKNIVQTVSFACSPEMVYRALMDSKIHSQFTGSKAVISSKVGGKFSVYDGYASGKNLVLLPNQKIVQSWRASDWPAGWDSMVIFELTKTKSGTKLLFLQENVPSEHAEDIASGWKLYYWKPLKVLLEK